MIMEVGYVADGLFYCKWCADVILWYGSKMTVMHLVCLLI